MNTSSCLQGRFLTLLPRIEKVARYHFRDQRCPNQKADRIAEVIALAWKWFVELEQRGKEVARFVSVLASLAARAVRSGRRLAGMEPAQDVLSGRAQQRRGFQVISLPEDGAWPGLDDALCDSTQTPPADAAAFRIDFPRWLSTLNARNRGLARALMIGENTLVAARQFQLSPARVSQLRQELHDAWRCFHGEPVAAGSGAPRSLVSLGCHGRCRKEPTTRPQSP
jgi:hypothetical protein